MRLILAASLLIAMGLRVSAETRAEETAATAPAITLTTNSEAAPALIKITPELLAAHRDYRLAQLRWQRYRFVELPRQRQQLDAAIRQRATEIRVLKRRVRDYRPFLRVGDYSPIRNAAEDTALTLQVAEQNLRQLKNERINLMRYSRQEGQLYQLEVLRSAARVRQELAFVEEKSG